MLLINQTQRIRHFLFGGTLLGVCTFFIYNAFIAKGVLEPGDGIGHYQIARFAPAWPHLYLEHWGKPFFTLLSSPFAQMGFPGMIVFNVFLFALTCVVLYRWATKQGMVFACLIPLLFLTSAVYFDTVNSGMTEILFACILTLTVVAFFEEKYSLGAFIFSFSLFSRPEANIIFPLFFLFLVWKKQWKAIPWLGFAFVIYSIIGYFYYKDILWHIHKNPYPAVVPFYGHGHWSDFIKANLMIWGPYMRILSIVGFLIILGKLFSPQKKIAGTYLFLLVLPTILVLAVHSYIWWKGIHGSIGLKRVMATVIPLSVILSLLVLDEAWKWISTKLSPTWTSILSISFSLFFLFILVKKNPLYHKLPIQETPNQNVLSEAADCYKKLNNTNRLYYSDPYFCFKVGANPYDPKSRTSLFYPLDRNDPSNGLSSGDVICWEPHFGANDFGITKDKLVENPQLEVIKIFVPDEKVYALNNYPYEVIIVRVK